MELTRKRATLTGLARLAATAEQFGYAYADLRQQGSQDRYQLVVVPDPRPQAVERAERNRARYPDAATRGPLPAVPAEELELLKARIRFDLLNLYDDKQRASMLYVTCTVASAILGARLGLSATSPITAALIAVAVWAVFMALVPALVSAARRRRIRSAAVLEAAGFARTTDLDGRIRYLPLRDRLPDPESPSPENPSHP